MSEVPLPTRSDVHNFENYVDKPLPIQSAIPDHLSKNRILDVRFEDFDQDPDSNGKNILLYRRLSGSEIDIRKLAQTASFSSAAEKGKTYQEVLTDHPNLSVLEIAQKYILDTQAMSPILHTTFDKQLSKTSRGAVITFSVPKSWILEHTDQVFTGAKSEKEVAFIHSIPAEFVKSISIFHGLNTEFEWDEKTYNYEEISALREVTT